MAKAKKGQLTYQPETLDTELDKQLKKYEGKSFASLVKQIDTEYELAWWYIKPKWDEWGARLKLYNNQKRDKEAVGDPLLFTVHQTVLAALYDDRLQSEFTARERGDIDVAENLNDLAEYDFVEMQREILDYEWDWDATFFGRAMLELAEFNRERQIPIPNVIDPMTFLRDPRATSINGAPLTGKNRLRFGGEELRMTKDEMKENGTFFNLDQLKNADADERSLLDDNRMLRAQAQGFSDVKHMKLTGSNAEYRILKWYTVWKGKRVLVYLANDRSTVIKYVEFKKSGLFTPIIDRPIYPMSHDWDGVSIPDIVEDKQRARSVIINLGLKGVKADLHPMYLFDTNKIENKNDLNFGFNKHIPVNGATDGALTPVQRKTISSGAQFILDFLDLSAQKATATPEIQQGQVSSQQRTLGELQLVERKVDTRYSLSAKIWGWSEYAFWKQWYNLYKEHFKEGIDDKMIRISGAFAPRFRSLTRENLIGNTDPDISIKSRILAESERFNRLRNFSGWLGLALSDPNANRRLAIKRAGILYGLHRDDIENIMPPTADEMKAETENEKLNANKLAQVDIDDDHLAHMEIHNKAADTAAKYAHMEAHKRALMYLKLNPSAQGAMPPSQAPQPAEGILSRMTGAPAQEGGAAPAAAQRGLGNNPTSGPITE